MPTVPIPSWNARGMLPPYDLRSPTNSANRSPYEVSLVDLVTHFADTPTRRVILKGLLDFRAALHQLGLTSGFQWVDGSFTEHIELIEQRDPHDIDVVSFVSKSLTLQPSDLLSKIANHDYVKQEYRVDSHFVELDRLQPRGLVQQSAYWYSVWSHRRDEDWKGFLELNLDPQEDGEACEVLAQYTAERGATS